MPTLAFPVNGNTRESRRLSVLIFFAGPLLLLVQEHLSSLKNLFETSKCGRFTTTTVVFVIIGWIAFQKNQDDHLNRTNHGLI